jgi:hypothetical protein
MLTASVGAKIRQIKGNRIFQFSISRQSVFVENRWLPPAASGLSIGKRQA